MSLEATALSPPQNAPTAPPQNVSSAADTPPAASTPNADATPAGKEQMGHNGGPDWRSMLAGDDAKAVEILSRFKDPADVPKTLAEQRAEITRLQQQKAIRLADNASPEQIAEYRKGLGLPDVGKDAKPEQYIDAYKIKAPDGYEMNAVEKGMVSDFAKLAYEQGHSPREVKAAVDFFFQSQAASNQALNKVAVDFQKAEQNGWRDAVGSKEYEAQVSAASSWLGDQFKDNPEQMAELLNARLPGGGKLGDSRWFGELLAKQAMGDGYTDRIEANVYESNGKSLAEQQREIEAMYRTDRATYALPQTQERYKKIIAMRQSRGEIDDIGNERKRA